MVCIFRHLSNCNLLHLYKIRYSLVRICLKACCFCKFAYVLIYGLSLYRVQFCEKFLKMLCSNVILDV